MWNKCDEPIISEEKANEDENADLRNIDELEGDEIVENHGGIEYSHQLKALCQKIISNGNFYLSKSGLEINSPKFLAMLNNIESPDHIGLHLVYSSFRSVEGIELFSKALNQNGFTQFKIKRVSGEWVLNMSIYNLSIHIKNISLTHHFYQEGIFYSQIKRL